MVLPIRYETLKGLFFANKNSFISNKMLPGQQKNVARERFAIIKSGWRVNPSEQKSFTYRNDMIIKCSSSTTCSPIIGIIMTNMNNIYCFQQQVTSFRYRFWYDE